MGNFNAIRAFTYVFGALINPDENNPNENTIYQQHNASMHQTTGHGHSGAIGDGPKLIGTTAIVAGTITHTEIANTTIQDNNVNWGTGAGQVSAVDVPIADAGGYFPTDNVEAALQDLASGTVVVPLPVHNHQSNPQGGTLDVAAIATGVLPVVRGGTGVAVSTGSVSVVLSNTPTIVTPIVASLTNMQHTHQDAAGGGTLDGSAIVTTVTGAGNVVKATGPTIDTPGIANFTSAQHDHTSAAQGGPISVGALSGVVPVANGGTGTTTSTGTGSVVLNVSPDLVTPTIEWDSAGTGMEKQTGITTSNLRKYMFSQFQAENTNSVLYTLTMVLNANYVYSFRTNVIRDPDGGFNDGSAYWLTGWANLTGAGPYLDAVVTISNQGSNSSATVSLVGSTVEFRSVLVAGAPGSRVRAYLEIWENLP